MILLAYDGSEDARAAVERIAGLMPGAEVTVATVWEPYLDQLARSGALGVGMGMAGSYEDSSSIDAANQERALATASEGAKRAGEHGLRALPRCVSRHGDVATTLLATAEEIDADLIAMGTRGLGGVRSFLLGSVSHGVVQHADRPVLVIPSAAVASERRERGLYGVAPS